MNPPKKTCVVTGAPGSVGEVVAEKRCLPISQLDLPEGICYTRGPKEERPAPDTQGRGVAATRPLL